MATKNEIIYDVLERLQIHNSDSNVSREYVSHLIDSKRALLLKQRYSKPTWTIPIEIKQEICMDIEVVNTINEYSNAGKTIKTVEAIPARINLKGTSNSFLVRREDGKIIPINVIPIERLPFIGNNKYTQMLTYAAIDIDDKLILHSNDTKFRFLRSIRVTDIFENPEDVYSLMCSDPGKETTDSWDLEYPIEISMLPDLVNIIVKDLAGSLQIPEDKVNDSEDAR